MTEKPEEKVPDKKEKGNDGGGERKKIGTIEIDVFDDLDCVVRNFPTQPDIAIALMSKAMVIVSMYFVNKGAQEPLIVKPQANIDAMLRNFAKHGMN